MSDRIPTGAYVIRNKKASTVLHVENPDVTKTWSNVVAYEQDENQYHGQQIWWIEPLPGHRDSEDGLVYSITNPGSGRSLDMNAGSAISEGRKIGLYLSQGVHWQSWRFQRVHDARDGVYYNIVNLYNEQVLDVVNCSSGANCHSQKYVPGNDQHCWELAIPVVAFPPGWFQIENVGTGNILSHTYLHDPPVLLPPPDLPRPSHYRESWEFQWTISHSTSSRSLATPGIPRNSWCIVNRLTRGRLISGAWIPYQGGVVAWQTTPSNRVYETWKLELDTTHHWKIINLHTSFLLQDMRWAQGKEVACLSPTFTAVEGLQSWVIRQSALEKCDNPPPEYEDSVDQ